MLSMIIGLISIFPLILVIGDLALSFVIGIGIFLGGLDILTCDKQDSAFPRGGVVLIGGLFVGMVAGWIGGPSTSIFSLALSLIIGIVWRKAFG